MKIVQSALLGRILRVGFGIHPSLLQTQPRLDANNRGLTTVDRNELPPFCSDNSDPVVPCIDAEESRIALLQDEKEFTFCAEGILPPDDLHFAVIRLCRTCELNLIRPIPPMRSRNA